MLELRLCRQFQRDTVEFRPEAALPFGLSWSNETPEHAETVLGDDTSAPGERMSFFLDDFLVLALHFRRGLVGLDKVIAVRVGAERDWRRRGA